MGLYPQGPEAVQSNAKTLTEYVAQIAGGRSVCWPVVGCRQYSREPVAVPPGPSSPYHWGPRCEIRWDALQPGT